MSISELFTIKEDFTVDLNREWISTIREFKALLVRDKGSKGDTGGRKKLQAQREFTFIYHYCDYRSTFTNYSEKDRRTNALKNAGFKEDFDINKDEELCQAVEVYKALQETPAVKMLNELKEGIHTAHKVVRQIRLNLDNQLDRISAEEIEPTYEQVNGKNVLVDPITKITTRLQTIMDLAAKLPKTLESIKQQEEEVKRELANIPNLKGKAQKGENEDPTSKDRPQSSFGLFS